MLRRVFRLTKDQDFKKVFKFSKTIFYGNLTLRYVANPLREKQNLKNTRIGFIISNKIDKRSTKRNELKRKMRAIIFNLIPKIKPGLDIVMIVKTKYEYPLDYSKIETEMIEILKKAKLLYD